VVFNTDIFGTFRQSLVLDFGREPVLLKELCVDSTPVNSDLDKLQQKLTLTDSNRWDLSTKTVVQFEPM
jgi:hypothetical protein